MCLYCSYLNLYHLKEPFSVTQRSIDLYRTSVLISRKISCYFPPPLLGVFGVREPCMSVHFRREWPGKRKLQAQVSKQWGAATWIWVSQKMDKRTWSQFAGQEKKTRWINPKLKFEMCSNGRERDREQITVDVFYLCLLMCSDAHHAGAKTSSQNHGCCVLQSTNNLK